MNSLFNNEGLDTLQPIRLAGLGGRISWECIEDFDHGKWHYEVQSVRSFAIVSKHIYLPYRIVRIGQGRIPGLVVYESDSLENVKDMAKRIQDLLSNGIEETISLDALQAGDVIHVPSTVGRHYAFYDGNDLIEYQPNKPYVKGSIQRTSITDFGNRIGPSGLNDIRRVKYLNALDVAESIQKATDKVGTVGFNLLFQNCETFATWAKTGAGLSRQAANNLTTALDWVMKIGLFAVTALVLFIVIKYGGIGVFIRKFLINNAGYLLPPDLYPIFRDVAGIGAIISVLFLVVNGTANAKALVPKHDIH